MCGKVLWEKTLVFGLTFAVGVFLVNALTFSEFRLPEVPQPESPMPRPLLEPRDHCTKRSKPVCKKFLSETGRQELESMTRLNRLKLELENKQLSRQEKKKLTEEIGKLEAELSPEKGEMPAQKFKVNESKPVHNLLHIENCEQY